jgi:glucose/mannose-6-phosphate isomerase
MLEVPVPRIGNLSKYSKLIVTGVGGSGIVGSYISNLVYEYNFSLPVIPVKDIEIPRGLLSPSTIVLAVSYSGNTPETLNSAKTALKQDATVIGVTSGGELAELLGEDNIIRIPSGYPPRASLPYLFIAAVKALVEWKIAHIKIDVLGNLPGIMEADRAKVLKEARRLSDSLSSEDTSSANKGPIIVGCRKYYPLAIRARQELAENAKMVSIAEEVPDAGHNLIVGYNITGEDRLTVALNVNEEPCNTILESYLEAYRLPYLTVEIPGNNMVEKLILGSWIFGLTSVHLASKKGLDPTDISPIKKYRYQLAKKLE